MDAGKTSMDAYLKSLDPDEDLSTYGPSLRSAGCNTLAKLKAATPEQLQTVGVPRFAAQLIATGPSGAAPLAVRPQDADSSEVLQRFKAKLRSVGVTNMIPQTEGRLLVEMYSQLLIAAHADTPPQAAVQLYDAALARISTQTRLVAADLHHLSINGPCHAGHPYILSAVDTERKCLQIVKILPQHEAHFQAAADRERNAIMALGLDGDNPPASCVPCRLLSIDVPAADAQAVGTGSGPRSAYSMPRFTTSLVDLPQLSPALILQAGQDVRAALDHVHACQLVHADVKAANVMVSDSCRFFLADWGACVKVEQTVEACTAGFHPINMRGQLARPQHDWGLLLVMLAIELHKARGISAVTSVRRDQGGLPRVQQDLVISQCQAEPNDTLREFLQEICQLAQWPWP